MLFANLQDKARRRPLGTGHVSHGQACTLPPTDDDDDDLVDFFPSCPPTPSPPVSPSLAFFAPPGEAGEAGRTAAPLRKRQRTQPCKRRKPLSAHEAVLEHVRRRGVLDVVAPRILAHTADAQGEQVACSADLVDALAAAAPDDVALALRGTCKSLRNAVDAHSALGLRLRAVERPALLAAVAAYGPLVQRAAAAHHFRLGAPDRQVRVLLGETALERLLGYPWFGRLAARALHFMVGSGDKRTAIPKADLARTLLELFDKYLGQESPCYRHTSEQLVEWVAERLGRARNRVFAKPREGCAW